jgi:hypothetical protein
VWAAKAGSTADGGKEVVAVTGATGSAAGFCAAPGRRIMVFSKSAFVVCCGTSATYLRRYLPSSMVSPFCRKCFLIDCPLTNVPLVLPKSSRKESLRIVITTACSPEIARLSIWMSLCGLRPIVVRSLLKGISLSIVVSMLSMSLAIVFVLRGIT